MRLLTGGNENPFKSQGYVTKLQHSLNLYY